MGVPYNTLVRTKKKLRKVNRKPLTIKSALALGQKIVDNDPRRSFIISRTKGKAKRLSLKPFNSERFRKPKGKTNLNRLSLVEKTKYAIDTPGEIRGITLKGIKAPKKRRKPLTKTRETALKRRKIIMKRRAIRIVKTKKKTKKKAKRFVKGSKEAKAFMAKLRKRRK